MFFVRPWAEAAAAVLAAADALRDDVGTPEAHAQALFLVSLLLEDLPRCAVNPAAAEALMDSLVRPGVTHASAAVRREAIKCLGLLAITTGVRRDTGECVGILRAALAADTPPVRCMAAKVGLSDSYPPRHPPRFRPSFPDFNGIL